MLYGKKAHLEALSAYKVRPSPSVPPGKWETGTQSFEAIAGLRACLAYLADIGGRASETASGLARPDFVQAMRRIVAHESELSRQFLTEALKIPGLQVHGISHPKRALSRTPTFGITLRCSPRQASQRLAERGIFVWDGSFYAVELMQELGLTDQGGLLRIGFAHYNTSAEVDAVVKELHQLA
jgi:selenocysteine lyase/cysteine desulfurase